MKEATPLFCEHLADWSVAKAGGAGLQHPRPHHRLRFFLKSTPIDCGACVQAVQIGWAPQEDLLPEPQGAAAGQDISQPAPLAWAALNNCPPTPGHPVPAWGNPMDMPVEAMPEPNVAISAAASLPEAGLGFRPLSLADAPQGAGALRCAARGGDPDPTPGPGPAAPDGGALGGGGGARARFHVFVGNLPGDATDAGLLDAFRGLPALEARVMRDHATGRSKGFGFVGFPCAPL